MNQAITYSLGICAFSLVLEGVFSGRGIKQRLAELRAPRYSPPLWGRIIIAAFYYVICFTLLYLLFSLASTPLRNGALALLLGMMLANALWNYFFCRRRNLFIAYVMGFPYSLAALALFILLLRLDRTAAWWLLPYVLYLVYANAWGYLLWKLNPPPGAHIDAPAA